MPSPFPGMDPYLESHWRDVHASMVIYIRDAIQDVLPRDLRARVEERVVLEGSEGLGHSLFPDVRVVESRPQRSGGAAVVVKKGPTDPILIEVDQDPLTEVYIEIIDTSSGNRVVTIIEVLSPTNKTPGEGMEEYKRKQREICQSESNLVEIDLLRCGRHTVAVPLERIPGELRTSYKVCVRRANVPGKAEVYAIGLPQRLPTVKIPLRANDEDVLLDLQSVIEQCYRMGRYEGDLDYTADPEPPWTKAESAWVNELLISKGLRDSGRQKRKIKGKPRGAGS